MGHLQTTLVLLIIGCALDAALGDIPLPDPAPGNHFLKKDADGALIMPCKIGDTIGTDYDKVEWFKATTSICQNDAAATCTDTKYEQKANELYNLYATAAIAYTDAGKYECQVSMSGGDPVKHSGELTVIGDIECQVGNIKLLEGVKANISCTMKYQGATQPKLTIGDKVTVQKDGDPENGVTKTTASLEITPEDKTFECRYDDNTKCNLVVETYASKVKTPPKEVTWAKVNTAATIPCTMKSADGYTLVQWFKTDTSTTALCTGTPAAEDRCDDAGYSLDKTKKHDLTVKNATTDSVSKYICNVQATDTAENEELPTQLAVVKEPDCSGVWADGKLTLNCRVEFKGTSEKPTVKWMTGTTEVPSTAGDLTGNDWRNMTQTAPLATVTTKYTCNVYNGDTVIATCDQSGAAALSAKFFQSTLLSLVVVFMMNQFK